MSDQLTIGFRAPSSLIAKVDAVAKEEGLSRADVLRRAAMRDVAGVFGARAPQPQEQQDQAA